jgi:hypothetical protein
MSVCAIGTPLCRERACMPLDWNVNTLEVSNGHIQKDTAIRAVRPTEACWLVCWSSSSCQRSPFGLPPKGSFMDVKVTQRVQNSAQETNIAQLLKKFSGFMEPKNYITTLGYHWFPSNARSVYSTTPCLFLYALWVRYSRHTVTLFITRFCITWGLTRTQLLRYSRNDFKRCCCAKLHSIYLSLNYKGLYICPKILHW